MIRILLAGMVCVAATATAAEPAGRPNVLMIAIDDMNDWVGCYGGHPQVSTPHIDRLAQRGTVFLNSHCQAPLCNPSRASLLLGLRPSTTGLYGLVPGMRDVESLRQAVTLPQYFHAHGYRTYSAGKVHHDGSIRPALRPAEFDVWGPAPGMLLPPRKFVDTPDKMAVMDWGIFPEREQDEADWKIADAAIGYLRDLPADQPFFLAVGFRLPHVPCFAPQKWFDLYPEESLVLPEVLSDDRADTPAFSWYLHWKLPEPRFSWLQRSGQWRPLVRAYLASTSFMDSQVGRVLDALEATGRAGNTVVVLWGDNGWHLGEKAVTGKNTLWEESTRVPLVFAGPGVSAGGRCGEPAELLDIYPTLVALCGLPRRGGLEGHDLGPQLADASAPRPWPAITTHNAGNHAIRSRHGRYIRYADGSEELYDHRDDPGEHRNRAADPALAGMLADHRRWLPPVNAPPVPGSAHRVLTRENGAWLWEGKPIDPAEKEE